MACGAKNDMPDPVSDSHAVSNAAERRRARRYQTGSCGVCHHEPIGDGMREVVWTDDRHPEYRMREIESCPWMSCPQGRGEH